MRKGIISVIFCIIAVFSLAVTANAVLVERNENWLNATHYGYSLLDENEKHAYKAIYDGVEKGTGVPTIEFESSWGITETQLRKIYSYYIFDSPEHCWILGDNNLFSWGMTQQNGIILSVTPTYSGNKSEMKSKFDGALDDIVGKISGSTKYEKALKAYDLLALQVDYDYSALSGGNNYAHRAYGAIVNSKAVCDGYAYAYQAILNALCIKAITVPGYGLAGSNLSAHAWNMVEFEPNKWAYVDVTWDDQFDKTNTNKKLGVLHYYFGRTDDMIAEDKTKLSSGGMYDHLIDIGEVGNRQTYDELPKCAENNEGGKSPYWFKNIIAKTTSDLKATEIVKTVLRYDDLQKATFDIIFYDSKEDLKKWVQSNATSICEDANMCDIGEIKGRDNYYIVNFYFHKHSTVEATCLDKAYCSICGKIMSNDFGPHTLGTLVPRVAATTTQTGFEAHYECSVCGCYFDKDTKEVAYESLIIQPYIPGDINGDGNVNNKDVIMLFNYSINKNLPGVIIDACNPDGEDGGLTNKDIIHLFKYVSRIKNIELH